MVSNGPTEWARMESQDKPLKPRVARTSWGGVTLVCSLFATQCREQNNVADAGTVGQQHH